jgi:hypothetical protein
MSFFSNILASVKQKQAAMKESREFQNLVEEEAKPIRRAAYMKQMLKEVVDEGIAKAKIDAADRVPKKKTKQDFGIGKGMEDPYKYLGGYNK